jgi:hypothetical protein
MSRTRAKQILGWSGAFLGLVLICAIGVLAWLLFTTSGARWVAQTVTSRFAPQISYAALDGTIAGELRVRDFRFDGAADAARIHISTMSVDPTLRMLLSRTLRIDRATVSGLTLHLPERPGPEEPDKPLWVQPPLEVVVSDFALRDAQILKGRERLLSLRQLDLAARWTRDVLIVERLALLPGDIEGELQANGRITPAGNTVRADLEARWNDVVIPEALAGRRLLTAGSLDVKGTPQRFSARGELDFGPPGEVAHIVLALQGTDRAASARGDPGCRTACRQWQGGVRAGGVGPRGARR